MRISPFLNTLVSVHKLSLTNKCFISYDVVDLNDINTDSIAEVSSSEDSGSVNCYQILLPTWIQL